MFRRRADGSGTETVLRAGPVEQLEGDAAEVPGSITADGKKLFYAEVATRMPGIWVVDLDTSKAELLLPGRGLSNPQISPDERWLAHEATTSGVRQVYVRPYPDVNRARWVISADGGSSPRWSRDGRELFYMIGRRIVSAATAFEASVVAKPPEVLFETSFPFSGFDVAPDGKQFLLLLDRTKPAIPHVIVNWFEELKRLVPPN
jgi:Tol biopolymer transport system component